MSSATPFVSGDVPSGRYELDRRVAWQERVRGDAACARRAEAVCRSQLARDVQIAAGGEAKGGQMTG